MGKYFGTDGFRGEANVNLRVDHAFKVGRFLGHYYSSGAHRAKIVIGKDTRRSSYMFEYALAAGITASGADAYLLHVTSTPSVAYVARTEDFDCGIMISASHNPFYDNGIKLIDDSGHKMSPEVEAKVEEYIDSPMDTIPLATRENVGRTVDYVIGRNRYLGYLISLATRSFKGMKVGLDCANGSAHQTAKSVFDALGAKTYVIGDEPDGTNINAGVGSTHIENLRNLVLENGLDVGFAFDGDADRCIAVDDVGDIVDGDRILYVCGKYLASKGELARNTVVTTVMSNLGLYKALEEEGLKSVKTDVGDKYVSECMVKEGYTLGGEQSGHIIFSKYATTGDGVLTALKVMEAMLESKKSLAELISGLTIYPQKLVNVPVADKNACMQDASVLEAAKKEEERLAGDGRVLLRKSGTEPLVRVMVEAGTDAICDEVAGRIVEAIHAAGY